MEMEDQIFRKVSVNDRLPNKEGRYGVFFGTEDIMTVDYTEQLGFHSDRFNCDMITHWLDKINTI